MKEKMKATFEWILIFVMAVGIGYLTVCPGVMDCDVVIEEKQDYTPDWLKEDPSRIGLGPRRTPTSIDVYLNEDDEIMYTRVLCEDGSTIVLWNGAYVCE